MKKIRFMHARLMPDRYDRIDQYYDGYHVIMSLLNDEVGLFYDDKRYVIKAPAFLPSLPRMG